MLHAAALPPALAPLFPNGLSLEAIVELSGAATPLKALCIAIDPNLAAYLQSDLPEVFNHLLTAERDYMQAKLRNNQQLHYPPWPFVPAPSPPPQPAAPAPPRCTSASKRPKPSPQVSTALSTAAAANRLNNNNIVATFVHIPHSSSLNASSPSIPDITVACNPVHTPSVCPNVFPSSAGAAAAMAAFQSASSASPVSPSVAFMGKLNLKMEDGEGILPDDLPDREENAVKRVMRAERNRQSAAASRKRKSLQIVELERTVSNLSQKNALLQVKQLQELRERISNEKKLADENQRLKRTVIFKDMKLHKLTEKLEHSQSNDDGDGDGDISPDAAALKRSSTWDSEAYDFSRSAIGSTCRNP